MKFAGWHQEGQGWQQDLRSFHRRHRPRLRPRPRRQGRIPDHHPQGLRWPDLCCLHQLQHWRQR